MDNEGRLAEKIRISRFRQASVILLLALLLRLFWASSAPYLDPFLRLDALHGDAFSYDLIATNLLHGNGFSLIPRQPTVFWPPLYPMFLAGVYEIAGHHYGIVRIIQALFGAVVPVIYYFISKQLFSQRIALLSAIGLATYPYLIYFGAWLIAEALFMALFGLAFYVAATLPQNLKYKNLTLFGLILGLCTLAKPITLFFLPFMALWIFMLPKRQVIGSRIANVILFAVSAFVVLFPWIIRNYLAFNQFILVSTNGGYTFLGANNSNAWGGHEEGFPPLIPGLNEAEREDIYYGEATKWIRSNPLDFASLLVSKYRRLFSPLSVASDPNDYRMPGSQLIYFFYYVYLILALTGMVIGYKNIRRIGFLHAPVMGVLVSAGLFYGDTRYTIPMVPSLVVFSALTIDKVMCLIMQKDLWDLLKTAERKSLVHLKNR